MVTQVTAGWQKGHSADIEVRSVFSVPYGPPAPRDVGLGAPRWPGCATAGLVMGGRGVGRYQQHNMVSTVIERQKVQRTGVGWNHCGKASHSDL